MDKCKCNGMIGKIPSIYEVKYPKVYQAEIIMLITSDIFQGQFHNPYDYSICCDISLHDMMGNLQTVCSR